MQPPIYNTGNLRERPGDDLARVQVHTTRQIDKAVRCPNVSNIKAPDVVRPVRIELLIQNVLQTFTEVGISGRCNPLLYPFVHGYRSDALYYNCSCRTLRFFYRRDIVCPAFKINSIIFRLIQYQFT